MRANGRIKLACLGAAMALLVCVAPTIPVSGDAGGRSTAAVSAQRGGGSNSKSSGARSSGSSSKSSGARSSGGQKSSGSSRAASAPKRSQPAARSSSGSRQSPSTARSQSQQRSSSQASRRAADQSRQRAATQTRQRAQADAARRAAADQARRQSAQQAQRRSADLARQCAAAAAQSRRNAALQAQRADAARRAALADQQRRAAHQSAQSRRYQSQPIPRSNSRQSDNLRNSRSDLNRNNGITVHRGFDSPPTVRRYEPSRPGPRMIDIEPGRVGQSTRSATAISGLNSAFNRNDRFAPGRTGGPADFRSPRAEGFVPMPWSDQRAPAVTPIPEFKLPADRPTPDLIKPDSWNDPDLSFTVVKTKFHDSVSGDDLFVKLHHQHHFSKFGFGFGHHDDDDFFFFSLSFGFGDSFVDLHHRRHFRTFHHHGRHDHFKHFGFGFGHFWCHDQWWPRHHFHHFDRFCGSRVHFSRFHGSFRTVIGCSCHWRWGFSSGWWCDPWWYEPCVGSHYGACYSDYAAYSWAAPAVTYASSIVPAPIMTFSEAWDRLSAGDFHAALDGFSQLLTAGVEIGPARIGYSLALGFLGRHEAASRSMRLAIVDEPGAIAQMTVDGRLNSYLQVLLGEYIDFARSRRDEMDSLFMIAALRFLMHEDAEAYFAIDSAVRAGDTQDSTLLLRSVIDQTMRDAIFEP